VTNEYFVENSQKTKHFYFTTTETAQRALCFLGTLIRMKMKFKKLFPNLAPTSRGSAYAQFSLFENTISALCNNHDKSTIVNACLVSRHRETAWGPLAIEQTSSLCKAHTRFWRDISASDLASDKFFIFFFRCSLRSVANHVIAWDKDHAKREEYVFRSEVPKGGCDLSSLNSVVAVFSGGVAIVLNFGNLQFF